MNVPGVRAFRCGTGARCRLIIGIQDKADRGHKCEAKNPFQLDAVSLKRRSMSRHSGEFSDACLQRGAVHFEPLDPPRRADRDDAVPARLQEGDSGYICS